LSITTASNAEFDQNIAAAKRAAENGPVIIVDHDEPAYILLPHEAWSRPAGKAGVTIVDLLRQEGGENIDFEPPRLSDNCLRPAALD
jgi:hypothetical protein